MKKVNFIPTTDHEPYAWLEHLTTNLSTSAEMAVLQAAQIEVNTHTINAINTTAL